MIHYFNHSTSNWEPKRPYDYINYWNDKYHKAARIDGFVNNYFRSYQFQSNKYNRDIWAPSGDKELTNYVLYIERKFFNDPFIDLI